MGEAAGKKKRSCRWVKIWLFASTEFISKLIYQQKFFLLEGGIVPIGISLFSTFI